MTGGADGLGLVDSLAGALLIVGIAFAVVRMVLGPSLADRVVALDFVTVSLVAFAGLLAIAFDDRAFLDLGLALALIGFLATVAFARYAERRSRPDAAGGSPEASPDD